MCHEASGRAMTAALGTGKGTVDLRDWTAADAIWLMGDNAATNAPRMLTWLAEAERRGAQLIHINPLIEAASRRTIVPHELVDMATFHTTKIGTMNVQVRIGGDMALLRGVAKAVFEAAEKDPAVLDRDFIEHYTHGFDEYRAIVESTPWSDLVQGSGVAEIDIRKLADSYLASKRVIVAWCLGLTQHENGVDTVREIVNVLLLRGNIGIEGAGPCPVRGHSNVQGNRTCGIDHRPGAAFLDRLAAVCGIDPPREHGMGTVDTIKAMQRGGVKVFVALGGNFALAAPDLPYTAEALTEVRADGAGKHEAEPQPRCTRQAGTDPSLPRSHRQGPSGKRRAGSDRRRFDGHGAHLLWHEGAGVPGPAIRVRDPRPAWPRPLCRKARRHGRTTSITTTGSVTRWRACSRASRT